MQFDILKCYQKSKLTKLLDFENNIWIENESIFSFKKCPGFQNVAIIDLYENVNTF